MLLPEETVYRPVLVPEFAGAAGVLFEEDTDAAVLEQGHGRVYRRPVKEQYGVLPSLAFVVADKDAHIAAFHRVGYAVQEYVAAVASIGGSNAKHVAVAGIGFHAFPAALGAPSLTPIAGMVIPTGTALAGANEYAPVGEFHQFGLIPTAIGHIGHLPCVTVVVAVGHKVV